MPLLGTDMTIRYCPSYPQTENMQYFDFFGVGQRDIPIKLNKTDKVILDKVGYLPTYRIIPLTNILEERASASVIVAYHKNKVDTNILSVLTKHLM